MKIGGKTITNMRYPDGTCWRIEEEEEDDIGWNRARFARNIEWSELHWENVWYENECKEDYIII